MGDLRSVMSEVETVQGQGFEGASLAEGWAGPLAEASVGALAEMSVVGRVVESAGASVEVTLLDGWGQANSRGWGWVEDQIALGLFEMLYFGESPYYQIEYHFQLVQMRSMRCH